MVTDPTYSLIHVAAVAVALGAVVVFLGTYLRRLQQVGQLKRYRGPMRLASIVAAVVALCVVLFVTSPLDYRSSAPTPAGLKLYVLSANNDLFTLRASDGAQTFVRHLPGPQLQMRYREGGLLILSGGGPDVPVAPTGTAGTAAGAAAASDQVSTYTLQAVRGDDGQAVLPALGALTYVTADTLDHSTLYVTFITDPAHPDAETLSAFSLQAGTLLWQHALTTSAPMSPQFCGSDSGALYVLLGTSLAAVRAGDGAVLWRSAPLWQPSPSSLTTFALRCEAQDGGVYIVVGGGSDADPRALIKLDERDGTQRWSVPVAWLLSIAGDRLYVIRDVYWRLVALRASDGAQIGAPLAIQINSVQAPYSDPSAGVLYVVGRSITPQPGYPFDCEVFAIRLRDGAGLWHRPPHACFYPHALRVAGDTLYYMTTDGDLTALRIADGGVLWTHTGYHRGAMFTHWSDTYAVSAVGQGVLFVDANHDVPCQYLWVLGCDPDNGQYLTALNPATGALYWRYRSDQISGYLLSAGA